MSFTVLLVACGGDDDGPGSGDVDASSSGDAAPGGDAGGDGDSGVACGRELATGLDLGAPDHMLADETHLYLAAYTKDEHRLWRIDRESGETELLAALPEIYRSDSLALDGDFVYLSGSPLAEPTPQPPAIGLFRVSRSGGEPERISTDNAESLAFDATHVYWLAHDTFQHFVIKRRAKSGGEEEVLVEADTKSSLGPRMTVLGEHVYWDVGVDLLRAPRAGGPSEVFGNLDPEGPPGTCDYCLDQMVAGDDGHLYWLKVASDGTHFYRTRSDVFELEPLVTDTDATAISGDLFYLFDGHLYWATQGPGIRRAPASGGEAAGVKERNAPAFVPTSDGLYTVSWLDVVRLMPLEGCPE